MSQAQNSLLGFLKKKSLFSSSPTKNISRRRSRTKSRDSKNYEQRSYTKNLNEQQFEEPVITKKLYHKGSQQNLPRYQESYERHYSPNQNQNQQPELNTNFVRKQRRFDDNDSIKFLKNPEENLFKTNTTGRDGITKNKDIWSGLVSYAVNFQSARIESAQCLETLSMKIGTQISSINYKIEQFNAKMQKTLRQQLKNVRDKINQMMEDIFKESDRFMAEYMKIQEKRLAGELLQMREILEKQYIKIENMRDQIQKTSWRKVAGEIISSEIQHRVEQLVKQSSSMHPGKWDLQDFATAQLKRIESQVWQIVRIK